MLSYGGKFECLVGYEFEYPIHSSLPLVINSKILSWTDPRITELGNSIELAIWK